MEDGGRSSGGGLQDQPSNRPALLGDKLPGGEPRMFCRKTLNRHRNQADLGAWDKPSESLPIGWTVTGRYQRKHGGIKSIYAIFRVLDVELAERVGSVGAQLRLLGEAGFGPVTA